MKKDIPDRSLIEKFRDRAKLGGVATTVKVGSMPGWIWSIPADKEREVVEFLNQCGSVDTSVYEKMAEDVRDKAGPDVQIAKQQANDALELAVYAKNNDIHISQDALLDLMAIHGSSALPMVRRIIDDYINNPNRTTYEGHHLVEAFEDSVDTKIETNTGNTEDCVVTHPDFPEWEFIRILNGWKARKEKSADALSVCGKELEDCFQAVRVFLANEIL